MLGILYRVWLGFDLFFSRLITPIVLGLFYFIVITPLAILARIFGQDFLRLKIDKTKTSYWVLRSELNHSNMKDQF
jgi:hypothetical protein